MSARAERRAMVALVAVFVLLVQMLTPTLAVAQPAPGLGEQVICTGHGLQTIQTGDAAPTKGSPAAACDHCVCPPVAATPAAVIAPVAFRAFSRHAPPEAISADLPPPARAPPRPPGQGPPLSNA
jgi:hypothetical protein